MTKGVLLISGMAVLAVAWLGPLPHLAQHSFAAHMGLHLVLIAIAAPLLALGLSGSRIEHTLNSAGLLNPILASVAEFVLVWSWHVPALHGLARNLPAAFVFEQATFLGIGVLLWLSAVGTAGEVRRAFMGVVALLFTSMHMTLLGALLALASRPLYAHHHGADPFGLTALQEQQIGGMLMLGVGGLVYLCGGLFLVARMLRPTPATLDCTVPHR